MQHCQRCLLPGKIPGICLNENSICNYCSDAGQDKIFSGSLSDFLRIIRSGAGEGEYDCLVCYSGGKDSTYTLLKLVRELGLRVLAFTFDHGYTSARAMQNIELITKQLNVPLVRHNAEQEDINNIFRAALTELMKISNQTVYGKCVEQLGPLCYVCGSMINNLAIRIARKHGIKAVITGFSPFQDVDYYQSYQPDGTTTFKGYVESSSYVGISHILSRFFRYHGLRTADELFLDELDPAEVKDIIFLRLFDYMEYDLQTIYSAIEKLGWEKPRDTDSCSTNCLLNIIGIYAFYQAKGYHLYAREICAQVRSGLLDRDTAAGMLDPEFDVEAIRATAKMIGVEF